MMLIAPDGARFDAYICTPGSGRGPGIVVLGGATGLEAGTRAWCERYADEGYVTIAPDVSRHFRNGALLDTMERANALGDMYVAKSAFAPYLEGTKTGALGIGGGAAIAWRAAVHGAVDACAVYGVSALGDEYRTAGSIACPVAIHASNVEIETARVAIAALRSEMGTRPCLRVYEYPRGSDGFFEPAGAAFEPHSASLAHSRSLGIFRPVLGPHYDLARLFHEHLNHEFGDRDVEATMETMVFAPYVNHVPTLTGGVGYDALKRFYRYHFIPKLPRDRDSIILSETVGPDTVVLELVNTFTHDEEMDYFLPGIPPSGKRIEIPTVVIARFRGGKLYHEHIYWDQASVLVQLGLLSPDGLPVAGVEEARKMLDQHAPANELMANWSTSEGKPI